MLGGAAFFVLRKRDAVADVTPAPSPLQPKVKRCRVHNLQRAAKNGRVRAFLEWWEFNGDFDLQIPNNGGVRFDDDREPDGQRWIYAQGRTRPGSIVTDAATADDSAHGHDAANDVYPVRQLTAGGAVAQIFTGEEADVVAREEGRTKFSQVANAARAFGLEVGADFPRVDRPHLQDPKWRTFPLAFRPAV